MDSSKLDDFRKRLESQPNSSSGLVTDEIRVFSSRDWLKNPSKRTLEIDLYSERALYTPEYCVHNCCTKCGRTNCDGCFR